MEDSTNQDQQMTITEEQKSVASTSQDRLVKIKQIDGSVVDIKVDPNVRRKCNSNFNEVIFALVIEID